MADYQKKIAFKTLPKRPEFIQPPFELQPQEPDILSEFPGIDLRAKMVISPPELPDTNLMPEAPNSAPETSDINAPGK